MRLSEIIKKYPNKRSGVIRSINTNTSAGLGSLSVKVPLDEYSAPGETTVVYVHTETNKFIKVSGSDNPFGTLTNLNDWEVLE